MKSILKTVSGISVKAEYLKKKKNGVVHPVTKALGFDKDKLPLLSAYLPYYLNGSNIQDVCVWLFEHGFDIIKPADKTD